MSLDRHERRRFSTRFLRIPPVDWPAVLAGEKRQLRLTSHLAPSIPDQPMPVPVVGYVRDGRGNVRHSALLVVERVRRNEPLLAISVADLALEGFDSIDEYRRYWNAHRKGFKPMARVMVYDVRPPEPGEEDDLARSIFDHLYGPWLRETIGTTS